MNWCERKSKPRGVDLLTCIGASLTVIILSVAAFLVFQKDETKSFLKLDLNNQGDFLAGFAGILAFLWLVIGFFRQSQELKLQREELEEQRKATSQIAEETARQAESIERSEQTARRDTFLRVAELLEQELIFHAVTLLEELEQCQTELRPPQIYDVSNPKVSDVKVMDVKLIDELWTRFSQGDKFTFSHALERALGTADDRTLTKAKKHDPVKTSCRRFRRVFKKIIDESAACDDDAVVRREYEWSPHGDAYLKISEWMEERLLADFRGGRVAKRFVFEEPKK